MSGDPQIGVTRPADADSQLDCILLRVGKLNYFWTNTESVLIHLIAGHAKVDKDTALIIFLTLNTTRARLDLVERLAKRDQTPETERNDILHITRRFAKMSSLRNRYNHCIYSFDPDSGRPKTIMMRISDRKDQIRYGKIDPINRAELDTIDSTLSEIADLNREIWQLIKSYGYPL